MGTVAPYFVNIDRRRFISIFLRFAIDFTPMPCVMWFFKAGAFIHGIFKHYLVYSSECLTVTVQWK